MDDVARGGSRLLKKLPLRGAIAALGFAAAGAACAVACAPRSTGVIGQSASPLPEARPVDAGVDAQAVTSAEDLLQGTTRITSARFPSKGHAGGRWDATVSANDAARAPLSGASNEYPIGARFVEEHFERDAGGPTMAMEKRPAGFDAAHGDWRYVVVSSAGKVVGDGPIESCRECHDAAPRDHVFALPAD